MLLRTALLVAVSLGSPVGSAIAQDAYPICQPPRAGEYLVLVISDNSQSQAQVLRNLPANTTATICSYQEDIVTRISGLNSLEAANSLARYMSETGGLPTYIVRSTAATATAPQNTNPTPSQTTPPRNPSPSSPRVAYNPQVLGSGYAVLVKYFNKPDVVEQVRKVIGRDVGLASYQRRPYLLANYTPNRGTADATVKALKERGLTVILVDSQEVVLLRKAVNR
ncbi:hypothetical protein BST81_10215 [Leptolyngbya sp. 'hensonii']|uniref:hypothetical protein n=1 Tax=Leptolyngbya sp. 'hensonii' TaxID=1922337 RepID=UPI00094FC42A|nr:hypothetical protein [Leptolyngbya sp. 'hensonii']OLP18461.1 hypothetical protein BST81_10215 [Leptolyngbya sp. 'hensonii']